MKILSLKNYLLLICFWSLTCSGQNQIKKYIQASSTPIYTIQPDSTDFTDLEIIGKAIGDSKVVMLGEQDHGDAPTFLAKTRIIKYLHEKKGFNVLAFESDFFGLNYGWDNLTKEKSLIDTFLRKNIFPVWTLCNTCKELFYNYIPETYETQNPLIISGFDNQMYLNYSSKNLTLKLDSVLRQLNLPITTKTKYVKEVIPIIDSLILNYGQNLNVYSTCDSYLNEIKDEIGKKIDKNAFWMMVIENLIQLNIEYMNIVNNNDTARDYQMAMNLKWLIENKFPKEKIIVWAASYHLSKSEIWYNSSTMGSTFTSNSSSKSSYVIGFASYEGEAGMLGSKHYTLNKPNRNGFENWIDKSVNFSFTDFKKFNELFPNNSETFYTTILGHQDLKREWNKFFDGIFFIRKMYPCSK